MNKGFVGFFDILGYRGIIENNQLDYAATLIDKQIATLGDMTRDVLIGRVEGVAPQQYHYLDSLHSIVVSDSIIIFFPFNDADCNDQWKLPWLLIYTFQLLKRAFDAGLPLRGSISYGDYYHNKNSFAGLPIVSSYELSESLNFSGCCFTDEALKIILKTVENSKINPQAFQTYHTLLFSYLAPLKDHDKKKILLNWFEPLPFFNGPQPIADIRQYVIQHFHAHGKNVSKRDVEKLENTERIIRYSKCLNEETFRQVTAYQFK